MDIDICIGGVGRVKQSTSRFDTSIISINESIEEYLITLDGILCLMMATMVVYSYFIAMISSKCDIVVRGPRGYEINHQQLTTLPVTLF